MSEITALREKIAHLAKTAQNQLAEKGSQTWTKEEQASFDNITFTDVYSDDGTEKVITAAASRWIYLNITQFLGVRYIKLRSGTSASPVAQGAQRTIYLVYS